MNAVSLIVLLWAVYLALTANLEPSNWVVGLLVALGITALLRPPVIRPSWRSLPGNLTALARYSLYIAWDTLLSGLAVARIVLSPGRPLTPGIVAIPDQTDNEIATALSAHAITITPGQMVVEMDGDGTMFTHCLDARTPETVIASAQQTRKDLLEKILSHPE